MDKKIKCVPELYNISLEDIFTKICKLFKEANQKNHIHFDDSFFGQVQCNLTDNGIEVSFSNFTEQKYTVFKTPIHFIELKERKEIFLIYDKKTLEDILKIFSNIYIFYIDNEEVTNDIILNKLPSQVFVKNREHKISFENFKALNNKSDIPTNKNVISINTNELISQDIGSLGIKRNTEFSLIIDKRNELINEIRSFMDSNDEIIMKIFGCDGVGKSISFIYLCTLKNNFKTVYFNLKEIHNANNSKKIEIFINQLITYFTDNISNINNEIQDQLLKKKYDNFMEIIQILEKNRRKETIDFWELFQILLDNTNCLNKVLFIIDQYKRENDLNNNLANIEENLIKINNNNIKLLIASSLNDMRVKADFLNILKLYISPIQQNQQFKKDKNDDFLEKEEDLFKDYQADINYLDTNEKDDSFEKIKIFNEIEEKIDVEKENKNKEDKTNIFLYQNYINNNNSNSNEFDELKLKKYRILYINDLISVKDYNEQEKLLIDKMTDFNYNPKYYHKFKYFYCLNKNENNTLSDLYTDFLFNIYNKIKSKIEIFFSDYNNQHELNVFSNVITKQLINLEKLVHEKKILSINYLIYYLNELPIKYIKIFKLDKNGNKQNENILRINNDFSSTNFLIEYSFPFIKFIITRLTFEYGNSGNIAYNDISSSGIGSLLEKQIRNSIIIDNIFNTTFYLRNFWAFYKTPKTKKKVDKHVNEKIQDKEDNQHQLVNEKKENENLFLEDDKEFGKMKTKKNNQKQNDEEYYDKIDFFNFKKVILDDQTLNPLDKFNVHYYIIPHNNDNKYLDSIILIPVYLINNKEKKFILISFQITINKKTIYTLEEYQNATIIAANLIEEIYDIKITDKYFLFVLAKDYNNTETQSSLNLLRIPFIFFSAIQKSFYLNEKQELSSINELINDRYKILTNKDKNKFESIHIKNTKLVQITELLKKKRKKDKETITENIFNFLRKKMFNNENGLDFPKEMKKNIIENIYQNQYYKNIIITIEYGFKVNFSRSDELKQYDNLLGIVFYQNNIFLINKNFDSFIQVYQDNLKKPKNKTKELQSLLVLTNKNVKISEKDENLKLSSLKNPNVENLLKYNCLRPSDIFVYVIYNIK